jgi:hypothetical protein
MLKRYNVLVLFVNYVVLLCNKLILESHVIVYVVFGGFRRLRLCVNVLNLKINIVLKASRAVVIRLFSLKEAPLGLFKSISEGDTFGEVPVKRLLISALRSSGAPFKQHTPLLSTFLGMRSFSLQ